MKLGSRLSNTVHLFNFVHKHPWLMYILGVHDSLHSNVQQQRFGLVKKLRIDSYTNDHNSSTQYWPHSGTELVNRAHYV